MPFFTPPTISQSCGDRFWGRYSIPVGQSVVLRNGSFELTPTPWIGEIAGLTEGVQWFQGGRTYEISQIIAEMLEDAGFVVTGSLPVDPHEPIIINFGDGLYGVGIYGS